MFERFSDRARRVVVLAQEEARLLNHNYIGTEHLLLGLIHEGEGVAAQALASVQITLDDVRHDVEEIIGPTAASPVGNIPFTPRLKKVLELSLREALQLGHNEIRTEHLLLALCRAGQGVAAQVLVRRGANLTRVRAAVIQFMPQGTSEPAETRPRPRRGVGPARSSPPTAAECPHCRSDLAGSLRRDLIEVPGPGELVVLLAVWCSVCGATLALLPPPSTQG
jgi:ATP-dependent Clp protease ATP-binding subunit ClpC